MLDQRSAPPNPLLDPSDLPYGLPAFDQITVEAYRPAIQQAMDEQLQAVAAIAADPAPPTFANTLVPLELSGVRLERALAILQNISSADTSDEIDAIDSELAPKLAAHDDAILLDSALYARVKAVAASEQEDLDPESRYLIERYLTRFRLAGAGLDDAGKKRLKEINERVATLKRQFKIRLQADSNELALVADDPAELEGLSEGELSAAATAAAARGLEGKFLIPLVLPTAHPHLASLSKPQTRERLAAAQAARGARGNEHDTRAILLELARLRAELAQLLGFEHYAALRAADSMAGSAEAVRDLLTRVGAAAAVSAAREQEKLEGLAGQQLRAADWPFYAERLRTAEYDIDRAALRPYFEAERVLRDGIFFAAQRLFGLTFTERPDLSGYHPDVRVFEVSEEDGTPVGLYLLDLYARESKRGGAWMSSFVDAASLTGFTTAVVVNNLNVPKPAEGEPTLLTFDETTTLFHEFGHALHGMLGRSTYPQLSGTNVFTDFVELPSQLYEMWKFWPEVMANYAIHHQTGEPIPAELVERLRATTTFNEGFYTSEYAAAALIDLAWHSLKPDQVPTDPEQIPAFEAAALREVGLDNDVLPPRYRSSYYSHIFSLGYAASYYAYLWSEVLDADTEQWFIHNGGLLRENGQAYREHVIGFGGTREPLAAYVEWRGRPAPIEPLLTRRGLLDPPAA
ncbi:MAG TPA: M3 family metallopeptidase [Solirubrobacteraceae bacterium]|nr:M3 family metallopeptidase [Solirubrobacteraceae bacterium]